MGRAWYTFPNEKGPGHLLFPAGPALILSPASSSHSFSPFVPLGGGSTTGIKPQTGKVCNRRFAETRESNFEKEKIRAWIRGIYLLVCEDYAIKRLVSSKN